jgi:predicted AAA+ superfamily ATPase
MIKRSLEKPIIESLRLFPVVGILGSRQTGKTTLAKEICRTFSKRSIYLDLELPSDAAKLADPEIYLTGHEERLVVIDEIQRMPELFPLVKALVDRHRINARFLLLGSASPDLVKYSSESLAGRIIYHQLDPLTLREIGRPERRLRSLWLRGGYPPSWLAETDRASLLWRDSFITAYLERDIPQYGIRVPAQLLRRFWTMLAHNHAHLLNASQMGGSLGVSAPTVGHYLDILENTFMLRRIPPYRANIKKRLVKSPKLYLRDSGLVHALLHIDSPEALAGSPFLGASWEGFVIEELIRSLPPRSEYFFYRSAAGAEMDFVFTQDGKTSGVEIKYSLSPKPGKGFWNSFQELSCDRGYIVYPGLERYRVAEKVEVIPVPALSEMIAAGAS